MAPLSLKIILDEAAITKILMFDSSTTVAQAHHIVRDKIHSLDRDKEYGFFLTSADDDYSGVWLEGHRTLEYYMLREGDSLFYLERMRNLRLRMLDGSVKTLQVDESKSIGDLMSYICDKIGATNYEEYGLCREHMEIEEEGKPMFGTLTLRKKTQAREKDVKLEQLSKKLKTDDNVEWLDQHKTLRELQVDPKETLLFKRRLYYSDRKVDARDPVQLNLLYVQTRDAILDGRQIVTEAKAVEFAGLQCQVHYDDFNEEKHKPGFIENLSEFLPAQYATSWGIEKKIFKEHKKHQGLSPLEAKHLYTKTARELPTYGVTFFLVKEKHKGKKKLIPRLLGINSESILRLDEETKEILQVWPLTQVKSYRAASESFTLDFGDYSEKEYAVKTNEAFRIKDILQGYIDIIRKKLAAPYNVVYTEGEAMCEDMVEISRGTVIQNIVPSKVVEQSFVGPSRIISVEQGHRASEGTKITTVHEVVTVTRRDITQQGARGEILSETPNMFGRRLNRINSLSVKSVVLLSDDNQENLADMHGIVADMENELPAVVKGVREICKKIDEEQSKELLDELDELCDYINNLSNTIKSSDFNSPEKLSSANDIAKKLADISAQMYLSLDPKSKRRSQLINSSRKSFIADEKTEAHLRRLSLKTAAETTHQVLDSAYSDLNQEYKGSLPGPSIIETLDKSVCIKMGKLNAAVAMLLNAHSDPKEINFATAVTCMTTIKELIPELVQDVKTLNSFTEDEESKSALTNQIKKLIDRTAALCRLNGTDDSQKLQEASNAYGEVARKLIYTFNRGERRNNIIDKENEIMDLAKAVAESSSNLLIEVNDLNGLIADDTRSEDLDNAGVKCADAARELYACAQLTAASIHEPHCQSALTGACENLTSSVNHLILTYKPIVDDPGRHYYGKRLTSKVTDLNKALERLMDAYANLSATDDHNNSGNDDNTSDLERAQKLKFIATISRANKALAEADDQLLQNDYIGENLGDTEIQDDADVQKKQSILNHEIAQLNNAVATLIQASRDEPDYGKMDILINNISQLIPEIIRDTKTHKRHIKTLPGGDNANEELFENLKDMLEATKAINSSSENHNNKDLNDAALKLAKSTGKLYWIFNPQSYSNRGNQIMDQSKDVGNKTSQLLMDTSELICSIGEDPRADELEAAGVKCADAAKGLMICAELIIPTIDDSYNEDALETACNNLETSLQNLTDTYEPIVEDPERYYYGKTLSSRNQDLMKALNKLKELLSKNNINDIDETLPEVEKAQRLKFISSLSRLTGALQDAEQKLHDRSENNEIKNKVDVQNLQSELTKKIAKLNAAIATLIHTESDIPNYERRNAAIDTIAHLTPEIIRDGKTLEAHVNGNEQPELSDNLRSILDATKDICTHATDNNDTGLTEAAMKFAESSRKLTYIFNPRSNLRKGNQVIDLAKDVDNKTSVLLQDTNLLSGMHDRLSSPSADDLKLNKAITACRDAAKELERCAKLTAPSIQEPVCQRALSAACEGLAKRLQDLALAYKPIFKDASQQHHVGKLVQQTMDITEALDTLKEAYSHTPLNFTSLDETFTGEDRKRLKFIASLSSAKKALLTAEQQIDIEHEARDKNKMIGKYLNVPDAQSSLSQNIALLNAAVATLLHATMDIPEYEAAEGAIIAISKLTPNILNAAECIHCENPRENILDKLKPLVKTLEDICDNVGENRFKDLNNNAMEFSEQSEKIYNEYSPETDRRKENQILELSRGACRDASKLLTKVYQLAKEIGGEEAADLDDCGTHIVDTAQVFLTAVQVTAPTMKEPECQSALLSFTNTFSNLIKSLDNLWTPLTVNDHQNLGDQLRKDSNTLQATLNKMKEVCLYNSEDEVNTKKEQLLAKVTEAKDKLKEAEMFSAKEKLEELPTPPLIEIVSIMTKDKGCIERVNIEPTKMLLCDKLSELNQIVALLVQAASVRTNMDHKTQEELVENFATLAPETVKNVLSTHKYFNDETSQALTEETKTLCEAGHEILASIETENIEELNNAVSKYAYSSGKLYYIFSPFKKSERSRENEILHTARSACERTSLMLSRVSRLAQTVDVDQAEPLDAVGVQLADAAHLLLTNAQLIAPSIRLDHSQTFLHSSIERVSRLAEDLGTTWSPLIQQQEQLGEQLNKDQKQLKLDLERLKDILQDSSKSTLRPDSWKNEDDINSELVPDLSQNDSKVPDRDLIIEETPLKELASKILNSAKKDMERGNLSPEERNAMKTFTNELSAAICALDLANARCKIDPLDPKKRQDLENVIQNLQHLCLISRLDDDQQSNIIDLMLFVKGVTSAADDVYEATASINPEQGKKVLMKIRDGCEEIKTNAENLSNPQDIIDDSLISDMLLIEKFAQDCDSEVSAMQKSVQYISDDHSRKILNEKLSVLIEKCDLLKFATKGSVSSAAGVAIEENLQNLTDAEKKIEFLLSCAQNNEQVMDYDNVAYIQAAETAKTALSRAVIARKDDTLPQALTQYAIKMLAAAPKDTESQLKLKNHLENLSNLLKKMTLARGRRVATWQDDDGDDVTDINKSIIKELCEFDVKNEDSEAKTETMDQSDILNLIAPKEVLVSGDKKELGVKLSQQIQKLSFMIGTVILSCQKPESLSRSVHATAGVVAEITAITRAIKNKDVIQGKRIEEASNHLIAATYRLLETSESVSQVLHKPESRRRLLDACRSLTDAVNKFAQVSSPSDKTKRDGEELQRNVQLQQILLTTDEPTCALGYADCLEALQAQGEVIHKLNSQEVMSRSECSTTLRYVTAAACASAEYAAHSAYLLSVSEKDLDIARKGVFDISRLTKITDNIDDVCSKLISSDQRDQMVALEPVLNKQLQQLSDTIEDSANKVKEEDSQKVKEVYGHVSSAMENLTQGIHASPYKEKVVISRSMKLLDAINRLKITIGRLHTPRLDESPAKRQEVETFTGLAKDLLTETSRLVNQVTSSEEEVMTWVMYGSKQVIRTYEALLTYIRNKGTEMKLLQTSEVKSEEQEPQKSHLQIQMDMINKWLRNPACKQDVKNDAILAAENIIDMGQKMCEDLKDSEKEEMLNVVIETKELLKECSVKYNSVKASLLLERVRELKGMLERGAVTRVVEEFLDEQPLEYFENIHKETDVNKRELMLDKKIAELLAQLARVSRTAKFVSDTSTAPIRHDLMKTSNQVELLAPTLVKAAQDSVRTQDKQEIENYIKLVMQYADSLSRIRELCDRAVDPMDFAQAAGETMARIKESSKNDPQKSILTSRVIIKLGNRVVEAGMSSANVQKDPELQKTLASIKNSISSASSTKIDLANEIIRKTGEVESALGGETIFQKEPEADQHIFAAAHSLHAAVREWSARDNEVVAVAKRVAVLMAQLAHHMYNDRKSELIATAKAIVAKSHEVAALARKLAMECSDTRIRNNLLQVCQRIPLISGQLKMLTTVKGSTLGKQGTQEDKEAMNMLIGNAQNLMTSIQEIVYVAESASVKINSQRGRRIRWVRRNYY